MGPIRKLGLLAASFSVLILTFALIGCGRGNSSAPPPTVTVTMTPSPTASMNLGSTLQFSASVSENKTAISTPISFISSNNKVLSFAPSGLACAGTWDASFIVCSPGTSGVVRVIASGFGTPSAPTTVYVHSQVTSIEVSPASAVCISQNQTAEFQATVLSGQSDITPFVGPVDWVVEEPAVATTSTSAAGLQSNQVQVTAGQPGLTHITPSTSGVNGQPAEFETCPVRSISVATSTGLTSLPLQKSSTGTVIPTVLDTQGNGITVSGLTWLSSQPGVATARTGGVVTAVNPGGTAITAVCDPPSCNTNLDPIYPVNVVNATVTGSSTSNTVYVTSTGCFGVAVSCQTSLIPIDTQSNTAGTAITLPSAPNSLVIDDAGTNAFMGTVGGLRQFNIAAIAFKTAANVKGNVLAVSPDANLVVVSDTADTPNVVSVVNVKSSSSTPLLLSGVTAAVFSPDSTIAYLLSGSTLYLYSTTHPLQTITLPGPATGAAFLATGAFGFVASTPSTVSLFNACNSTPATSPNTSTVSVSAPAMMAALPDGKTMAVVNSPGFSSIAVSTPGIGCPPGETATAAFHSFGQGSFTPKQLLVSSDGNRLYVISDLDLVMVYDFTSNSARAIALNPSATPLSAALTRSGTDLYVGASDGTVHHLDTSTSFSDVGQIPVKLCSNASISCPPNLLAARP